MGVCPTILLFAGYRVCSSRGWGSPPPWTPCSSKALDLGNRYQRPEGMRVSKPDLSRANAPQLFTSRSLGASAEDKPEDKDEDKDEGLPLAAPVLRGRSAWPSPLALLVASSFPLWEKSRPNAGSCHLRPSRCPLCTIHVQVAVATPSSLPPLCPPTHPQPLTHQPSLPLSLPLTYPPSPEMTGCHVRLNIKGGWTLRREFFAAGYFAFRIHAKFSTQFSGHCAK